MKDSILGHFLAIFSVGVWSSLYVSVKILLQYLNPLELLFLQSVVGYLFLWILKPMILKIPLKKELFFALCGIFGIVIYNLFLNLAMERTFASNISVIIATAPLFAGIFSFLLKIEKPYFNFFIGFVIAIIGVYLLSFKDAIKINYLGDCLGVISAMGWGIYAILVSKVMGFKYDLIITTRKILFYGIVFMTPTFLLFDFSPDFNAFKEPKVLFNFIFVALFASAICFIAWNKATNLIGVVRTNIFVYLTPVFTIFASMIFLGERLSFSAIVGIVLVMIGVMIGEYKKKRLFFKY